MTFLKVLLLIPHSPVFSTAFIVADLGELYNKASSPKILPGFKCFINLSFIITYTIPLAFFITHKIIKINIFFRNIYQLKNTKLHYHFT